MFFCIFFLSLTTFSNVVSMLMLSEQQTMAQVDSIDESLELSSSENIHQPLLHTTELIAKLTGDLNKLLVEEGIISEFDATTTVAPLVYNSLETISTEMNLKQNQQVQGLIYQVQDLSANLENAIQNLNSKNRRVSAAMLKSMLNSTRRLESSLTRFQNRFKAMQTVFNQTEAQIFSMQRPANLTSAVESFLGPIQQRLTNISEETQKLIKRLIPSYTPKNPSKPATTATN